MKSLFLLILISLLSWSICRAGNWTNYPAVSSPSNTDTFLIGTTTTNKQVTASNVLAWVGANIGNKSPANFTNANNVFAGTFNGQTVGTFGGPGYFMLDTDSGQISGNTISVGVGGNVFTSTNGVTSAVSFSDNTTTDGTNIFNQPTFANNPSNIFSGTFTNATYAGNGGGVTNLSTNSIPAMNHPVNGQSLRYTNVAPYFYWQ